MHPPPEYRPGLPEKNDNVSHNHPLKEFGILISGVTALLLLVFWVAGLFVGWAAGIISPEMEAAIFSSLPMPGPEVAGEMDADPRREVLQKLVEQLGRCNEIGYPLQVNIVNDDTANALAFPGGRIVVFEGLLDSVRSENGLAFVLAHEMAHFRNRDHLRSMGRGLVFAALSSLLTGSDSGITQFIGAALGIGQARYSQERESMADRSAIETLNCYYGHVGGATEFFEAMQEESSDMDKGIFGYLSSHPETVQRIEDIHNLTAASGFEVEETRALPEMFTDTLQ